MLAVDTEPGPARAESEDQAHVAAGLQACPPDILDLVLWHERDIGLLLSAIDEHEQALAVELHPALAARRDEIARATARLSSLREHEGNRARVGALTSSWSWRATAPARRLYDWYLTVMARARGGRS
jgi:hypothetical protein